MDAFSRYTWIYLLRNKSDSFQTFQNFKAQAKLQLGFKIKCLQSDWRGEFCAFTDYLTINGIIHRIYCPHTYQQNGVAERNILLRMVLPYLLEPQCLSNIGMNHSEQLYSCIIGCPLQFHMVSLPYSFFLIMFLITRLLDSLVVLAIPTLDHIIAINLPFGLYNVHF